MKLIRLLFARWINVTVLWVWTTFILAGGLGGQWVPEAVCDPLPIEIEVLTLLNQERESRGLHALSWNDQLFEAARLHSEDMAANRYHSHTSLDGTEFWERITDAGYIYSAVAENIGYGQTTAQIIFDGWMGSDGHRENMLSASYCDAGVGYARSTDRYGTPYWTLDLGRQYGVSQCPEAEPLPEPEPDPEPDPEPSPEPEPDPSPEPGPEENPDQTLETSFGGTGGGCFIRSSCKTSP